MGCCIMLEKLKLRLKGLTYLGRYTASNMKNIKVVHSVFNKQLNRWEFWCFPKDKEPFILFETPDRVDAEFYLFCMLGGIEK